MMVKKSVLWRMIGIIRHYRDKGKTNIENIVGMGSLFRMWGLVQGEIIAGGYFTPICRNAGRNVIRREGKSSEINILQ